MAKRKSEKRPEQRFVSRKHLSRAEREAQQRQLVVIGAAIVFGLVAVLLVGGLIYQQFITPGQTMATVYDETIDRAELYQRINYQRYLTFEQYQEARQQYEEAAASPESSFLSQIYAQQVQQLQQFYTSINNQTLEILIEDRVVQKIADDRGLSVSEEEIDDEIRRRIATEQGALIAPDVTATAEGAANATATAAQFTPTPEPTIDAGSAITETEGITETEVLTPTVTPLPTATPNILSDDDFESNYQAFISEIEGNTGVNEAAYRELVRLDLLRQKVQEDVEQSAEIVETEEQVHVRHILVESEEEAQTVLERLESGEDFAVLAAELSTDTGSAQNGGDLDWVSRETLVEPFADAAFALRTPGERSDPVETQFGWHIIELIEGPEQRPLSPEREQQLRNQSWNELLLEERTSANVIYEWDIDDVPRDPYISEIQEPLPTPVPLPTTDPDLAPPAPDSQDDEAEPEGETEGEPDAESDTEPDSNDEATDDSSE